MHNLYLIRRRFGKEKGNRIILILASLSLILLGVGVSLLVLVQ